MRRSALIFVAASVSALTLLVGCSSEEASSAPRSENTGGGGTGSGGTGSGASTGAGATSSGGDTGSGGDTASGGSTSSGGDTGSAGTSGSGGAGGSGGGGAVDDCVAGTGTEDVGSGSLRDKATCLMWQKASTKDGAVTNRGALAHCAALVQDGFDDWRLPTTEELRSYPDLEPNGNAYLAGPTFIPSASTSDQEGCVGNSHSCNLTQYSKGNFGCGWQGPGANSYPVLCVRGSSKVALDAAFTAAACCPASLTFKQVDCSAYP